VSITHADGSLPRLEDARFLTGHGRYTADHDRANQLHAAVVRSPHAHAEITSIDVEEARAAPGVVAIVTEADLAADGLGMLPCGVKFPTVEPLKVPPRYALARGRVRHVGDPVAFVVAESREAAIDAAELVMVDYDPLPVIVDQREALQPGAPEIWPVEVPGNRAFVFQKGDREATDRAFAEAAHVVELSLVNNRVSAFPLEPRAAIGEVNPETGQLVLELTAQGLHGIRDPMADSVFGLGHDRIHLFAEDVGGGFGLKNFLFPEWILVLWAARHLGRPVKWVADNADDLQGSIHGRAIDSDVALALDANGKFLGLRVNMIADLGAYASGGGPNAGTNAASTAMGGIYDIPAIFMETRGAYTNTTPVDAYRGAGKPEANYVIERLIDAAARRCGFDPVELRRKNVVRTFPYPKALGAVLDCGRFAGNIEDAVRLADRDGFEARRATSKAAGKLRGLGVACFLESARGVPQEEVKLLFRDRSDGVLDIEIVTGTESNGQGHETAFAQVAADRLGLPIESFTFTQADTRRTRTGFGHGGARSMHMGAGTLAVAIDRAIESGRAVAARLLQASVEEIGYAAGRFAVTGSDRSVGLAEVAVAARKPDVSPETAEIGLDTTVLREDVPFSFPGGCHLAEVEVDPETGHVAILRYVAVDDYGTLVNPMLTEGQVHGGLAQGIGQALSELVAYETDSGQLLSGSLMDYALPRAVDLPAFEVTFAGDPTAANLLGVKGSGQAGCISAPPTIVNAVVDALSPLGIDEIQMPATPLRIWEAIQAAKG
jgi:carbon-monoxide dehydrogenase large subunit